MNKKEIERNIKNCKKILKKLGHKVKNFRAKYDPEELYLFLMDLIEKKRGKQ